MARENRLQETRSPRGRYVYAWFNDDSPFPFYVGKGVGDRAWQRHMTKGQSSLCTKMRASSRGFWCHVVRDNLTNEGAMLLESCLIDLFTALGACTANQVSPLRRQEVPPLWLQAVKDEFIRQVKHDQCEEFHENSDALFESIISVLNETEGMGRLCLNPSAIAVRVGCSRDRVVSCMKRHGLNP
jgi:hypothetical protein